MISFFFHLMLTDEVAEEGISFRDENTKSSKSTTRPFQRQHQQHRKPYSKKVETVDRNHTTNTSGDKGLDFSSFLSNTVTSSEAAGVRNYKQLNSYHNKSALTNNTMRTNDVNNRRVPGTDSTKRLSGFLSNNVLRQSYSNKSNLKEPTRSTDFHHSPKKETLSSNSNNNELYSTTRDTLPRKSKLSRFMKSASSTTPLSNSSVYNNSNNNNQNATSKPSKWSNFLTSTTTDHLSSDDDDDDSNDV